MGKLLLIALLALMTQAISAQGSVDVRAVDAATLSIKDVTLLINFEKSSITDLCPSASSWRWGVEQSCPGRKIGTVKLLFKGRSVFVPYSAFADLGNPTTISLLQTAQANTYSIRINGGDAATSYISVLRFKGNILHERHVKSGEFPDDAWEKTSYRFNLGS